MHAAVYACLMSVWTLNAAGPEPSPVRERQQIIWYRDYELAVSEAKLLRRPLLALVTSKWSPACLRLERGTFVDPNLVTFVSDSMIAVQLDADASPELAERLRAERLPLVVVLSAEGVELGRVEGYRSSELLLAELSRWRRRTRTVATPDRPRVLVSQVRVATPTEASRQRTDIRVAEHKPTDVQVAEHKPADIPVAEHKTVDVQVAEHTQNSPHQPSGSELESIVADVEAPIATPPLMLGGFCPVSMLETKKLVRGDPSRQLTVDGWTISFSSLDQLEKFRDDPARYLPVLDGLCPVSFVDHGRETPGAPRYGAVFRNRLVLLAGPEERGRFQADPKRYVDCDLALEGHCPVCGTEQGRLVPGRRELQHYYQKYVYRFDSEEHQHRFIGSPHSFTADN